MAISTGLALALGGAAALGGSAISSSAQKSAANTAADTSLAVAQQNNALARDIFGQNQAALAPWQQGGQQANALLMDAYGFNASPAATQEPPGTITNYYSGDRPDAGPWRGTVPQTSTPAAPTPNRNALARNLQDLPNNRGGQILRRDALPVAPQPQTGGNALAMPGYATPQVMPQQQAAPVDARSAFDVFKDSMNYDWQLQQGLDAVNSGYAGSGVLQSGAAMKAINDYGQNTAQNAFQGWLGGVSDIANRGLGAASAQAGVGQNFVSNVSANNNAAGTAAANAALANSGSSFGNALGLVGGTILGNIKW